MSTHEVKVIRIEEIRPHSNADSLELTNVFGYQCVIRKGAHKVGDLMAFIEPDTLVDITRNEFKFLDEGKGKQWQRITMKKLRGERSYGLLIPAPAGSQEGDNVFEQLGVQHYEPQLGGRNGSGPSNFQTGIQASGPKFTVPAYDLENFRRLPNLFHEGERVILTVKIHGTNARYVFDGETMHCGSRTTWKMKPGTHVKNVTYTDETGAEVIKTILAPECAWWSALEQNPWIETWCLAHPNMSLYGEVYGCFQYKTPIKLSDGSQRMIGEIVNNKMPLTVKSLNLDSGVEEDKKIIGWSKTKANPNDWMHVTYRRKHWGGKSTGLILTKNHRLYTTSFKEIHAEDLHVGDTVFLYAPKTMNFIQEQLVLGSLMGDGYMGPNHIFSVAHCDAQKDYLDSKYRVLSNIATTAAPKFSGHASIMHGLHTCSLHNLSDIDFHKLCYSNNGKKFVTKQWLDKLTPLALAIWYCDDGSLSIYTGKNPTSHIATNSFSNNEMQLIVDTFRKVGIESYCNHNSSGNVLAFSSENTKRLHLLIAPYIHPSMRYKLIDDCKTIPYILEDIATVALKWSKNFIETVITAKRELTKQEVNSRKLHWKYDIEIEDNHNYFANKILVHNSNVQGANFSYGKKQGEYGFAVFDILDHGRWVDNGDLFDNPAYSDSMEETVKVLYRGPLDRSILEKMAEEKETLYPNQKIREGIVIKLESNERFDSKHGRVALKYISDQYLMLK